MDVKIKFRGGIARVQIYKEDGETLYQINTEKGVSILKESLMLKALDGIFSEDYTENRLYKGSESYIKEIFEAIKIHKLKASLVRCTKRNQGRILNREIIRSIPKHKSKYGN